MSEYDGECSGGHTVDPCRLAQCCGPDNLQLVPELRGQAGHPHIIQVGREHQLVLSAERSNIGLLALDVASIESFSFQGFNDVAAE